MLLGGRNPWRNSGKEIGRRECVPGNIGFNQNLDSISMAEPGSVHEWGKAFTIEERNLCSGVYQSSQFGSVAFPRRLTKTWLLASPCPALILIKLKDFWLKKMTL